ncbi:MAG: hypothetical protein FJ319_13450 [SAR202 cluster bacterium]|nr:hypothetical protein [SAR202 cluster bacterium]
MKARLGYLAAGAFAVLAIALAVAAVFSYSSHDGGNGGEALSASAQGAQREAIDLHGHRKIEVSRPSGEIARSIEFDNELTGFGVADLVAMLLGYYSSGPWSLAIMSPDASPCPSICRITEPDSSIPDAESRNLVTDNSVENGMRLHGSMIAPNAGEIVFVSTTHEYCEPTVATADCSGSNVVELGTWPRFTTAELPTPLQLEAGHQVIVTVDLVFSIAP